MSGYISDVCEAMQKFTQVPPDRVRITLHCDNDYVATSMWIYSCLDVLCGGEQ